MKSAAIKSVSGRYYHIITAFEGILEVIKSAYTDWKKRVGNMLSETARVRGRENDPMGYTGMPLFLGINEDLNNKLTLDSS